jgi:signal transduction histidine kinase
MRHWWRDTLFKRLFVLMWAALFVSHFAAYAIVSLVTSWANGSDPDFRGGPRPLPTMPSLPSGPGLPRFQNGPPQARDGERPPYDRPRGDRPGFDPRRGARPPPLPTSLIVLDYAVRLFLIGIAAWFGARWLSRPMGGLVAASRELTRTMGSAGDLPSIDEHRGTVEVREAARVFNEMARQLNAQFRSRGLMMAALSHDLRTPLTRMRVRLEALEHEPAAQRCFADIHEMNLLLSNVLQLFRDADADEPLQATDIYALVHSVTDDLIEQGQSAVAVLDVQTIVAPVRPLALKRVVTNLVQNAIRYGERAEVRVLAKDGSVEIIVDDYGRGIPEHELETVFLPFYRRDSSRSRDTGGTGLGLYIARDLVQRQGGTLTLVNRTQGGLRARVQLPQLPQVPQVPQGASA